MPARIAFATGLLMLPAIAFADSHDHGHGHGDRTAAPEGASVYFVAPAEGATVSNPVTFNFGLRGMGVAPAGVEWDNTGHHHMLINIDPAEVDLSEPLPATDQIRHFGGGQTEVTLDLPAGTHTFHLVLGDWLHVPHDPPIVSDPLTITVE